MSEVTFKSQLNLSSSKMEIFDSLFWHRSSAQVHFLMAATLFWHIGVVLGHCRYKNYDYGAGGGGNIQRQTWIDEIKVVNLLENNQISMLFSPEKAQFTAASVQSPGVYDNLVILH